MGNREVKRAKLGFCSFSPGEQLQRGRYGSTSVEMLFLEPFDTASSKTADEDIGEAATKEAP
jgi:hypothetical protein